MKRVCLWESTGVHDSKWVGAIVENDCLIRRFCLPRRTPEEVIARLIGKGKTMPVSAPPSRLQHAVERYFKGIDPEVSFDAQADKGTPFQMKVWLEAKKIKRGEVRTYGWLAWRVGHSKSVRAVGRAMGANPLPLFVP